MRSTSQSLAAEMVKPGLKNKGWLFTGLYTKDNEALMTGENGYAADAYVAQRYGYKDQGEILN